MRTDGSRTILACSRGPQLAAAIRSVVPPELALVRWSAEADLESNWQCCQPWPWVIVGAGAPPPALADFARFHPVVVRW
ncbi:MAG: hypothetical protein ACREN8_12240, partial [Candidatus Dormibacteraceae bacterium]